MNMREKMARAIAAEVAAPWDNLYENKADWTDDRGKRGDVNGPFREDCFNAVDAILDAMRKPENEDILQPIYLASYAASEYGNDDSLETWQDVIDAIQAGK